MLIIKDPARGSHILKKGGLKNVQTIKSTKKTKVT